MSGADYNLGRGKFENMSRLPTHGVKSVRQEESRIRTSEDNGGNGDLAATH